MPPRVVVTKDRVVEVIRAVTDLVGKQVLVGVPENKTNRQDGEPVNNATLAYIHEFGSPSANIPARSFLIPGVTKAQEPAAYQMKKAAKAALDGKREQTDQLLNAAGILASNEARGMINSNLPPPLSPTTIANRHRQRKTKSMRESEQVYLQLVAKGVYPAAAQAETGIIALINTGALRNSITYVVRKK